ncbi:hypothetical protein Q3G72_026818 [Acer saccharum]|nr:hypothetical protein Q3G72_026818 [Acer saccharum]
MDDQTQPSPEKNSDETVEIELSIGPHCESVVELGPENLSPLQPNEALLPPKPHRRCRFLAYFSPGLEELVLKKLLNFNEITSLHGLSKVSNTLKELTLCLKTKFLRLKRSTTSTICRFQQIAVMIYISSSLLMQNDLVLDLCGLKCIKKISLQSNRLTSMKGFEDCVALAELYLSHNGILKMEGLSTSVNLKVLGVSSNKLTMTHPEPPSLRRFLA